MENTTKKYGKTLSFLPLICFTLWSTYFFITTHGKVVVSSINEHANWVAAVVSNHNSLLVLLVLTFIITATILIYFTVHIARIKNMGPHQKLGWLVFMVCFGAFSFPVFWYRELRNEPKNIDVYPSIA